MLWVASLARSRSRLAIVFIVTLMTGASQQQAQASRASAHECFIVSDLLVMRVRCLSRTRISSLTRAGGLVRFLLQLLLGGSMPARPPIFTRNTAELRVPERHDSTSAAQTWCHTGG